MQVTSVSGSNCDKILSGCCHTLAPCPACIWHSTHACCVALCPGWQTCQAMHS